MQSMTLAHGLRNNHHNLSPFAAICAKTTTASWLSAVRQSGARASAKGERPWAYPQGTPTPTLTPWTTLNGRSVLPAAPAGAEQDCLKQLGPFCTSTRVPCCCAVWRSRLILVAKVMMLKKQSWLHQEDPPKTHLAVLACPAFRDELITLSPLLRTTTTGSACDTVARSI